MYLTQLNMFNRKQLNRAFRKNQDDFIDLAELQFYVNHENQICQTSTKTSVEQSNLKIMFPLEGMVQLLLEDLPVCLLNIKTNLSDVIEIEETEDTDNIIDDIDDNWDLELDEELIEKFDTVRDVLPETFKECDISKHIKGTDYSLEDPAEFYALLKDAGYSKNGDVWSF